MRKPLPDPTAPPSRSALKRAAKEIETLAHSLVQLPESAWKKVPAPPDLREELELARAITAHGARSRQIRHLAALLRQLPAETQAIYDFVHGVSQDQQLDRQTFHRLEELREQLCDPEQSARALDQAVAEFPALDRAALHKAVETYRKTSDKKDYRVIFRLLQSASRAPSSPAAPLE